MAIRLRSPMKENFVYWEAGAALYANTLVKEDSGAKPVATAHSGATIIGLCMAATGSGAKAKIYPVGNAVLEIDYLTSGTKTSFDDDDLGTKYDMSVNTGVQSLDPDDTTGGFLSLVGYDNDAKVAYVRLEAADLLIV